MQAGESLSFITIPEELAEVQAQSELEASEVWQRFGEMVQMLMLKYPDAFESMERPEEIGAVTVSEGSFQVLFSDGSYLHIVAYGHQDEVGFLDLGLSVVEHSEEGQNLGGYLYEMTGDGVKFSKHRGFQDEDQDADEDEEDAKLHFSILGLYKQVDEFNFYQFSDNDALRQQAVDILRKHEERAQLTLREQELGFGWAEPTIEDVEKLEALLATVSPFEAPRL